MKSDIIEYLNDTKLSEYKGKLHALLEIIEVCAGEYTRMSQPSLVSRFHRNQKVYGILDEPAFGVRSYEGVPLGLQRH